MPTNLVRSVEDVASGDNVDFKLDVVPQTSDFVSNVTATLNFTLNGATTNVPFAFADGSLTNVLYAETAAKGLAALPNRLCISNDYLKAVMGELTGIANRPFLTGDVVEYYATVNYFADNADTDESKLYENRYFPDNHQTVMVGDVEHWVVEGTGNDPYKPVTTNFTVTGPAISVVGTPKVTAEGITFLTHAYAEAGNIASVVVKVNIDGKDVPCELYKGANTNRLTKIFNTADYAKELADLKGGASYSFTVVAYDAAGNELMETGGGFATLSKPATRAPAIQQGETNVVLSAAADYVAAADGNSEATEYAVRVTTSKGGDAIAKVGGVEVWQTLADWKQKPVTGDVPLLDLTAINYFSFLTRNDDGVVVTNMPPVTTNCEFKMTADIVSAVQKAYPYGQVDISIVFGDPAQSEGAMAQLEYSLNDGKDWMPVCGSFPVWFDKVKTSSQVTWDAWSAVGKRSDRIDYQLRAKVTAGDRSSAVAMKSFSLDFKPPEGLAIVGEPPESAVTNGNVFSFAATAKETKQLYYYWETNGVKILTASDSCAGVGLEGTNTVSVYAVDAFSNVCSAVARTWVVDTTPPTAPAITGTPANGAITNAAAVALTAKSEDKTRLAYHWTFNGETSTGATLTGSAKEGANAAEVYATDEAGNVSKTSCWNWTLHTGTPKNPNVTGLPINDEPSKINVTNGVDFALTATAEDDFPLTFHWTLNGAPVPAASSKLVSTKDLKAQEGTNTVTVYAKDAAGNACAPIARKWVVDTVRPEWEKPAITGAPEKDAITKDSAVNLVAHATDKTRLTYHWTLNGAASTGATLTGLAKEGANAAEVYATDEAGNVSTTNCWNWTLDTHAPTNLVINGSPEAGVVTNGTDYSFTASALDATALKYYWTTNSVAIANPSPTCAADTGKEGTNTVSVYAVDAAGNRGATTNRTWVIDTIAPSKPVITGIPANGALTNSTAVALTAASEDATKITYHWTYNGVKVDGASLVTNSLAGAAVKNAAEVYATDEAGNVSATNYWNWTVDTVPPSVTNLTSTTPDPFGKGTKYLEVTVMFSEPVVGFAKESVTVDNKATVDSVEPMGSDNATFLVKINPGDDGTISVSIPEKVVKDEAGNDNLASSVPLTRTYDTQPPADFKLTGTPNDGDRTKTTAFKFTASAVDTTALTYHWITNGIAVTDNVTSNFEGVVAEGTNTFSVSVEDALGNPCDPIVRTWIVDYTPPAWDAPPITGSPANGSATKSTDVSLTAHATDRWTQFTYHWLFNGKASTGAQLTTPSEAGAHVENTASVYAVDEAGNVSATNYWNWVVDTVAPKVTTLSADKTPTRFSAKQAPMVVTAAFSEPVTNFTAACVTVEGGSIEDGQVEPVAGAENTYTFAVMPLDVEYTNVTVQIKAGVVADAAGNGNEASAVLSRIYDNRHPIVTLETKTPEFFKGSDLPFVVTATFVRGKDAIPTAVTNFTADVIEVENGTVTAVTPSYATNVYTFAIAPNEGAITVRIPEAVVADLLGNENAESDLLIRTYDNTPPTVPVLTGIPVSTDLAALVAPNGTAFNLTAKAEDLTAVAYHWTLNDAPVSGLTSSTYSGSVPEGTNSIVVYATDLAGNVGGAITNKWVVDQTKPVWAKDPITGEPETNKATQATGYNLTAHATDVWTKMTYSWELAFGGKVLATGSAAQFTGSGLEDGDYVASAWVTDEAGNVSTTNTWGWTVDTEPPQELKIEGDFVQTPGQPPVVTSKTGFTFTASATDRTAIQYFWMTNGVEIAAATNKLEGVAIEGTNWVIVVAKDAAGNTCAPVTNMWIVDTTPPQKPDFNAALCSPAKSSATNVTDNTFTIYEITNDLTTVTYHWQLTKDGVAVDSFSGLAPAALEFSGDVEEKAEVTRAYQALVWAVDAAGNVSATNTMSWTYDATPPQNLVITDLRANGKVTRNTNFTLLASATDATACTFYWALNGQWKKEPGKVFEDGVTADGVYTASVYAVDAAMNVSVTNDWVWTVDMTPPDVNDIEGVTPEYGCETNSAAYELSASSDDVLSPGTNFWVLVKGGATVAELALPATNDVATVFKGEVNAGDGVYTAKFWSVDAAGNASTATNTWGWTVDTVKPVLDEEFGGTPTDGAFTNEANYALSMGSTKQDGLTYHWALLADDGTFVREWATGTSKYAGAVEAEGVYTAMVYTVDRAGNVSTTNTMTWTYDITKPKVMLTTTAPDYVDSEYIRTNGFEVTVMFSERISDFEPIPDFIESCVTIANGTAKGGAKISETEYSFKITPRGWGPISVTVAADAVKDLAGNGNVASKALSRLYVEFVAEVETLPTVDLSGYPLNGSTTNVAPFELTAKTTEVEIEGENVVIDHYYWCVNGVWLDETEAKISGMATQGVNTVYVYGIGSKDYEGGIVAKSATWTWTYKPDTPEPPTPAKDVDFGGGISLPIDEHGKTGTVSFVEANFNPGADSTFVLSGFDGKSGLVSGLTMSFLVKEKLTDAKLTRKAVKSDDASFEAAVGEEQPSRLTVTLPAENTTIGEGKSFFIIGVDNKE